MLASVRVRASTRRDFQKSSRVRALTLSERSPSRRERLTTHGLEAYSCQRQLLLLCPAR